MSRRIGHVRITSAYVLIAGLWVLAIASCRTTQDAARREESRLDPGWRKANMPWHTVSYPPLRVAMPGIPHAEFVHEDALCQVCHKAHVEAFQDNVHRRESCESCHGPASRHLETRGEQPGTILSFKTMKRAERAEVCSKCHEQNICSPGANWRTSAHAHHGVDCTQCHTKNHYNVPEGTPTTTVEDISLVAEIVNWKELLARQRLQSSSGNVDLRTIFATQPSPHDFEELPSQSEAREDLPSLRGTSNYLGAMVPTTCYRCHTEMVELETVAHPHQINGPNGFNCTTCHDTHGNVLQTSRKELCLECHKGSPTQAWHSSVHDEVGVACTDCHNPHSNTSVEQLVNISHTSIRRPNRLPMSVNEPQACYKCHPKILGLTQLPSHHPIIEGKMTCSDCHDPHGQAEGNLTETTVNMVCYKCHADKQGPFVYEHPPVNEDCSLCHEPHGTVANNLLRQPPAFLCLRCHAGHNAPPADHFGIGTSDIDGNPSLRPVFYTNCTQCHSQIHGSDLPSQHRPGALLR